MSELVLVKNEALHAINNLKKWMQPQHVERNLVRVLCFHKHNIIGIILDLHNLFFGENIPSRSHKEMYCAGPAKAD